MFISKLRNFLYRNEEREKFDINRHVICDECGGGGLDFIAGPCLECGGNGFLTKTIQDKINQALEYKK